MSVNFIKSAIPHREPFLLIDEIVEQSDARIASRDYAYGRVPTLLQRGVAA